ncbi:MAG: MltA domain-containing protein [Rickettsiales bacterium]|jgi:membrane-bound lytic murein transglycosylase A|nr:MltA domain-containing protein [Rickettsiales bacterium]
METTKMLSYKIKIPTLSRAIFSYSLILLFSLSGCGLFEWPWATGGGDGAITADLTPVPHSALPGWKNDDHRYALAAMRHSCNTKINIAGQKVRPDAKRWEEKCANMPGANASAATARQFFEDHFQPYKVADSATKNGKFTGYYSPVVRACRTQTAACSAPIMDKPTDGREYKNVPSTRLVNERIGRVIYWIDPIDLQDMGSATLILEDGTNVRLSVASTNDMTFNGIGSQLLARGIRPPEGYGMKSVRAYLKQNRDLADELIANNPRYVYYTPSKIEAVTGHMGVPLTKIRSVAIDKDIYALGMPVWLDTKLSNGGKFQRLMMAQDTGGAIIGMNRADIYFGTGDEAFEYAHGQNQPGQMYIFLPK